MILAANSRLQELALSLSLKCLSFDFVGTSIDESSEEFGTVQVHFFGDTTEKFRLLMNKIGNLHTWPLKLLLLLRMCFTSICFICISVYLVNLSSRELFVQGLFCWLSLILQIPSSWKSILEDSSTLQIYFDYYALTKPPISKEVCSSISSFVCYTRQKALQLFFFFDFCIRCLVWSWCNKTFFQVIPE